MKITIGSDHAGFELKENIKSHFSTTIQFDDKGPFGSESVDYPDYAHLVSKAVVEGDATLGILICGSANGVAITANKYMTIRAAICWTPELAHLARSHNDANILCLPARFIAPDTALDIVQVFLNASFEGGRHQIRVGKIPIVK